MAAKGREQLSEKRRLWWMGSIETIMRVPNQLYDKDQNQNKLISNGRVEPKRPVTSARQNDSLLGVQSRSATPLPKTSALSKEKSTKPLTTGPIPSSVCNPPISTPSLPDVKTVSRDEEKRLKEVVESKRRELDDAKKRLKESSRGFEAMTVAVRYLTEELDAFGVARLKNRLKTAEKELSSSRQQIAVLVAQNEALGKEIDSKSESFQRELQTSADAHQRVLRELENGMREEKERELEAETLRHRESLTNLKTSYEKAVAEIRERHDGQMAVLRQTHAHELASTQHEWEHRLGEFRARNERDLSEITYKFECIKATLSEKVDCLRAECDEMRHREATFMSECQRDADMRLQSALSPYRHLPQEIESLRVVLDLKTQEARELRQRNLELEKQLEELPITRETIKSLQQKVENLEAIVNIRADYEKELAEKHQVLLRRYDRESKVNKRLSMDKEELEWRLMQGEAGPGAQEVLGRLGSDGGAPTPEVVRRRKPPSLLGTRSSPRNSGCDFFAEARTAAPRSPGPTIGGPAVVPRCLPSGRPPSYLRRSGTYELLPQNLECMELKQTDL